MHFFPSLNCYAIIYGFNSLNLLGMNLNVIDFQYFFAGKYQRKNLNMPKRVPQRPGGGQDFKKDSPITEIGVYQARMTGKLTCTHCMVQGGLYHSINGV